MSDNLAQQYADSIHDGIIADMESGNIFGVNEDTGEELSAYDWLEDVLDIEYLVNGEGQYRGAELLLTYGGPNAYLDTKHSTLTVYWGSGNATRYIPLGFTDYLNYALEEYWEATK